MENLYLIVGLGNPGDEYTLTRHNAGFEVVDRLADRWRTSWSVEKRFSAKIAKAERSPGRVLLCQPQTFMNLSGEAVRAIVSFYQVSLDRLLVVVDDADLPLGELRMRPSGSSGGHHGLESVESHLGSRASARLRVGIGRQGPERQIAGHVLGRFSSTEAKLADKILEVAADQANAWLEAGIQKAMSLFNGSPLDAEPKNERKTQ